MSKHHRPFPALALGLLLSATGVQAAPDTPPAPALVCSLSLLPPKTGGSARPLRLVISNPGSAAVQVLEWATPFEGWLGPFVRLQRDGVDMPYLGATVKRGDPGVREYLLIEPGQQRQATVDLADAFDLTRAGVYQVLPQLQLRDVVVAPARAPRPRAALQPRALDCPGAGLSFTVTRK